MTWDKATLLHAADIAQSLNAHGEAGEIEESLRRLAAIIPDAPRPEVVANDELSRQLDHVAFNIMSHSPMTGTEARIVTKAARALESTRSPLGSSTACHLCEDPQQCAVNKHCAFAPCKSPFPSVSS